MNIHLITPENLDAVISYANRHIGLNYYSEAFFTKIATGASAGFSFALVDAHQKIRGLRLTLGPGDWLESFEGRPLYCRDQSLPLKTLAYFKTVFVDKDLTGQGWGGKLSRRSMDALSQKGATGIICHSVSSHSAHNSSARYLKKLGFVALGEAPKYWESLTQVYCHICSAGPCQCDAVEMYCELSATSTFEPQKGNRHEK